MNCFIVQMTFVEGG